MGTTLQDLAEQLPNGFHDMFVERLTIDFTRRLVSFEVSIWVAEVEAPAGEELEARRSGRLTLSGLIFCVLDPPALTYPYAKPEPAWVVDLDDADPELPLLRELPAGAFAARFYVNQWNGWIHVAALDASLTWSSDTPAKTVSS